MAYEFKDGINKYLNDLGETKPANDLSDLIRLTYSDSIEMKYFNLLRMENSNSKVIYPMKNTLLHFQKYKKLR